MLYEDFYSDFTGNFDQGNLVEANTALMRSLGTILVKNRPDFVHLLNESDIPADVRMTDAKLVNLFIQNIAHNPSLMLGASLLVNHCNCKSNFDGEKELEDRYVKAGYVTMRDCFSDVTGILRAGANVGERVFENQQNKKYAVENAVIAKKRAQEAMTQQVITQRQQELDAKKQQDSQASKSKRTALVVTGVVIGAVIIAGVIYAVKKNK